jgi:hypothetical protein
MCQNYEIINVSVGGKILQPFGVAGKATAAEARFIFRPVDEEILHSSHKNQVVAI